MAIEKISESDVNRLNVKSAPDIPDGDSTAIKQIFDNLPEHIVKKFNELVDSLLGNGEGQSGADNLKSASIEGISGETVREQLKSIVALVFDRYTKAEIKSLVSEETNKLISSVDVNLSNGVITIKQKDGTTKNIDTAIEKVPAKFEFMEESEQWYIKVTNVDGTSTKTNVSSLMNQYRFDNSEDISFSIGGSENKRTVSASIRDNSIGLEKLSISAVSTLENMVNTSTNAMNEAVNARDKAIECREGTKADLQNVRALNDNVNQKAIAVESARSNAEESKNFAKSYAIGGTGVRAGEDLDNAKYYASNAREEALKANNYAQNAQKNKEKTEEHLNVAMQKAQIALNASQSVQGAQTEVQRLAVMAQTESQKAVEARSGAELARSGAEQAKRQAYEAKVEAQQFKTHAETAKIQTEQLKIATEQFKTAAETAKNYAKQAKQEAETAKQVALEQAENVKNKTQKAIDSAEKAKLQAQESKNQAEISVASAQNALTNAKQAEESKKIAIEKATQATNEANRAKNEADRVQSIVGGDFATKADLSAETNARTEVINAEVQARTQALQAETQAREAEDNKLVTTAEGAHGIRYVENALQVLKGSKWEDVTSSSGGDIGFSLGDGELEDFEFEVGEFVNAGAGWNSFVFEREFDALPKVFIYPIDNPVCIQIKNITQTGFQYSVMTQNGYLQVTAMQMKLQYLAVGFGGER